MWEQGGPEAGAAGGGQEVCGGGGGGEDGEGVQRHLHGDQLQGRPEHPGQPRLVGQRDVQQRGCRGSDINTSHQVRWCFKVHPINPDNTIPLHFQR